MTLLDPSDYIESYLDDAVRGERRAAIRLTLDLFDNGVPQDEVIADLLCAAQHEVGDRWYRNELSVVDEHVASGVAAAALDALVSEAAPHDSSGHTVVSCAEGDWHSLAAQMFGESLRSQGIGVTVLGASTPADMVADSLVRRKADSLAVSCSMPSYLPGVAALVDAAHREGYPVIVGGRALGTDSRRAEGLGADGWALTAREAAEIVSGWGSEPPAFSRQPTPHDAAALRLAAAARSLGRSAFDHFKAHLPSTSSYGEQQLGLMQEDLVVIVQFLAASMLVDDEAIFEEFVEWMQHLVVSPGIPPEALITALDALQPVVDVVDEIAGQLLETGRRHLVRDRN
jgi:methanogenic corrinoid protein MtbC1